VEAQPLARDIQNYPAIVRLDMDVSESFEFRPWNMTLLSFLHVQTLNIAVIDGHQRKGARFLFVDEAGEAGLTA